MATVPACTRIGRHCRELRVTLYVADTTDPDALQDGLGTWLMGHTQRISFGTPYRCRSEILVDAVVRVECKYLDTAGDRARCTAHEYSGKLPAPLRHGEDPTRRHGDDRFTLFHDGRVHTLELPQKRSPKRALPTLQANPCATASCRTADNTRGAACCRDLTLDIILPADRTHEEDLLRSRKSPYLCKVERVDERSLECEVISACDYLSPDDGISCSLHGRRRPNGTDAKPSTCVDWPDFDQEDFVGHPGCVFLD